MGATSASTKRQGSHERRRRKGGGYRHSKGARGVKKTKCKGVAERSQEDKAASEAKGRGEYLLDARDLPLLELVALLPVGHNRVADPALGDGFARERGGAVEEVVGPVVAPPGFVSPRSTGGERTGDARDDVEGTARAARDVAVSSPRRKNGSRSRKRTQS
jgi:hypothetical protein